MRRFSLFLILLCTGCATSAMRNGVAQARYEVQQAMQTSEPQSRLARADAALSNWQKTYGSETRQIDDNSLYPVLEQMESEGKLLKMINSILPSSTGSLLAILFGTGGTGTLLISLILKLLQERGKRRDMENAASDCAAAIESINDLTAKREAKETVRKHQTSRTRFNKIVQETSKKT